MWEAEGHPTHRLGPVHVNENLCELAKVLYEGHAHKDPHKTLAPPVWAP